MERNEKVRRIFEKAGKKALFFLPSKLRATLMEGVIVLLASF